MSGPTEFRPAAPPPPPPPPPQPQQANPAATADQVQRLAYAGGVPGDAQAVGGFLRQHPEQRQALQDAAFSVGNYSLYSQLSRPDAAAELTAPNATGGIAGAAGREGTVQGLLLRAYHAGLTAPQESFNGSVYRSVPNSLAREGGALDFTYSPKGFDQDGLGRYNGAGERVIYTSPSATQSISEMRAYPNSDGQPAMSGRSMVSFDYVATPDASGRSGIGRGGIANVDEGMQQQRLPLSALTADKGAAAPSLAYRLTGEHPYGISQQVAKGATDAGASAIRAPASQSVGGEQIDIIPRNTDPSQLTPRGVVRYGADGVPGSIQPASHVNPLPVAESSTNPFGVLQRPAGGGIPNQSVSPAAPDGLARASSVRYGAAGGAVTTIGTQAYQSLVNGAPLDVGQLAQDTAISTGVGAASARGFDALAPRIGVIRGGGAVGAVVEGGMSAVQNIQAYQNGQIDGSQAIANTAVDTGVGLAAGLSGAAVGAAVGSVVPIAGTAVGAVVGFAAGIGASYAIHAIGDATGAIDAAKAGLSDAIDGAADIAGDVGDAISGGASKVASFFGFFGF